MNPPRDAHTPEETALQSAVQRLRPLGLKGLFEADGQRFGRMHGEACGLLVDWSRQCLDDVAWAALFEQLKAIGFEAQRRQFFAGAPINVTENRAVAHMALRAEGRYDIEGHGDVLPAVQRERERFLACAQAVRSGTWRGETGRLITDVVNIGIGGSDLGPKMVIKALRDRAHERLTIHCVSNVDGSDLTHALRGLDWQTTLFIVTSKTFTTQETLANAEAARAWFLQQGGQSVAQHFVAVSTNREKVVAFGIAPENMFGFWDWVGGRYSLWSAVGLAIAMSIGIEGFMSLLAGARCMDQHFLNAAPEHNLPVRLALVDFWNRRYLGYSSRSVAPYDQRLARLPAYFQQLEMESLGKSVSRDGKPVTAPTGLTVWGEPGTNGQHAYFQLLHQGSDVIPVEFILVRHCDHALPELHRKLLANGLAQAQALMQGKSEVQVMSELRAQGMPEDQARALAAHKVFSGNRPSTTIVIDRMTPEQLGSLIALFEHKVFTFAALCNIYAFDQWGVELGKVLAGQVLKAMQAGETGAVPSGQHGLDSSAAGLLARLIKQ